MDILTYDETQIKNMSKDELRDALRDMQMLVDVQQTMIERQTDVIMSYKCLLDDLSAYDNFRDHMSFIHNAVKEHKDGIIRKYAEEITKTECCTEAHSDEPS